MGWFGRSADDQRQRAARGLSESPLTAYLTVPFADEKANVDDVEFLALDYETTGLDPQRHHVVAVGFVPVVGGRVELSGARSFVVAAGTEVGSSATVHGITDDALAGGVPLAEALAEVLAALSGRVLLAHFATLEERFTAAAVDRLWSGRFVCQRVDTLDLQRRLVSPGFHDEPPPGSLRLWAARERYGLPVYRAHEPLIDAISCAELLLAQVAEMRSGPTEPLPLKRVLG